MTRRRFVHSLALLTGSAVLFSPRGAAASVQVYAVTKTDDQWREQLPDSAYRVLRLHDTERPFTSPLLTEHRSGTYHCLGCQNSLYRSDDKFDSGTGWPSFTRAIENGIGTRPDRKLFLVRTEVHCSNCGGHLGHVFDDGPPPTGKRHCINGVALSFRPV